jgi:hypothetical protein
LRRQVAQACREVIRRGEVTWAMMRLETVIKYSLIIVTLIVLVWAIGRARAFLIPLTFSEMYSF